MRAYAALQSTHAFKPDWLQQGMRVCTPIYLLALVCLCIPLCSSAVQGGVRAAAPAFVLHALVLFTVAGDSRYCSVFTASAVIHSRQALSVDTVVTGAVHNMATPVHRVNPHCLCRLTMNLSQPGCSTFVSEPMTSC